MGSVLIVVVVGCEAATVLLFGAAAAALLLKNFLLGATAAGASIGSWALCGSSITVSVFTTGAGAVLAVSNTGGLTAKPPRSRLFVGGGTLVSSKQ